MVVCSNQCCAAFDVVLLCSKFWLSLAKGVKFSVEEGNCMVKLIKDAFGIEGETLLQKFDKEWEEFIDLDSNAVVEDKSKLRVILKVCNM